MVSAFGNLFSRSRYVTQGDCENELAEEDDIEIEALRGINLAEQAEIEYIAETGQWLPVVTAKNVARILHAFFTKKRNACVAFS